MVIALSVWWAITLFPICHISEGKKNNGMRFYLLCWMTTIWWTFKVHTSPTNFISNKWRGNWQEILGFTGNFLREIVAKPDILLTIIRGLNLDEKRTLLQLSEIHLPTDLLQRTREVICQSVSKPEEKAFQWWRMWMNLLRNQKIPSIINWRN